MRLTLTAMMLLVLAPVALADPIDWQAELDRCRALREQVDHCCWQSSALWDGGAALRLDRTAGAETWRGIGAAVVAILAEKRVAMGGQATESSLLTHLLTVGAGLT